MQAHQRRIVTFLSQPQSYPHPVPKPVIRRETHVSHVFLAGPFAYKLKKAVRFPFLDASTLALRKKFCLLELSLNRRLAPTIYLGIVPIIEQNGRLQLGGRGKVVEWVVKMRRLPEERMLDQLLAKRRVGRSEMTHIAQRLNAFFKHAKRSPSIRRYGTPVAVSELLLGNLRECQPFMGVMFSEEDRRTLEASYRQFLALHEPMLTRRMREGRIIDGHGDLRCENICLTKPVSIFDCVEFQPAFRCGDMANDLSFLIMDLEFHRRPELAQVLVETYRRQMADATFERVLPVYKCHRSLVRGKVRGLAWQQRPRTVEGRRIHALSRRHFQLAKQYAAQCAPPRLIIVGGVIGTGKSTLARALAQALGATWLRTDEIRLTEFSGKRSTQAGFATGLYAPQISEQVYERLIQQAVTLIRAGHSVVCDGTFSKVRGREALRQVAKRYGASFYFFECVVPRAVALCRIAKRYAAKSDISEAKPEHYDRLRAEFEPVLDWSAREWTRLSDNRPPEATYRSALNILRRVWYNESLSPATLRRSQHVLATSYSVR